VSRKIPSPKLGPEPQIRKSVCSTNWLLSAITRRGSRLAIQFQLYLTSDALRLLYGVVINRRCENASRRFFGLLECAALKKGLLPLRVQLKVCEQLIMEQLLVRAQNYIILFQLQTFKSLVRWSIAQKNSWIREGSKLFIRKLFLYSYFIFAFNMDGEVVRKFICTRY